MATYSKPTNKTCNSRHLCRFQPVLVGRIHSLVPVQYFTHRTDRILHHLDPYLPLRVAVQKICALCSTYHGVLPMKNALDLDSRAPTPQIELLILLR